MSTLTTLKIVSATKPRALPAVVRRRRKLVERLEQQRRLAEARLTGEHYAPKRLRSITHTETGERITKEVPVRIKTWWWTGERGELLLSIKYGSRAIELAKGKTAIEVGTEDKLCQTIDAVITAVNNGELDQQLEATGKRLRDGFKR